MDKELINEALNDLYMQSQEHLKEMREQNKVEQFKNPLLIIIR